jgi:hypothetical protein
MHRFGEHDIGSHIDETLGLEEGTYSMKEKAAAEQGSETTTTDQQGIVFHSFLAIRKAETFNNNKLSFLALTLIASSMFVSRILMLRGITIEIPPVLESHEKEKKKKHLEACLGQRHHFTPFVVSTDALLGREAKTLLMQISTIYFSWQRGKSYSEVFAMSMLA